MKKICMIVQNYYDIDPRVRREAESLIAAGYAVDVIALRMESQQDKTYELNGVKIYTLLLPKKRTGKIRYIAEYFIFLIWAFVTVTTRMMRYRYQVIQIHTLPDFLVFAALVPKLMGAKVILDLHEIMPEFFMSKYGVPENHWMIRLLKLQEKLSIRFADEIITINNPIKTVLETRVGMLNNVTILMNSTDQTLFAQTGKDTVKKFADTFIFLYHGTLTRIYGLDIALNAFALAENDIPNAQFWLAGDGPERRQLELLTQKLKISNMVKFFGSLPQQEIPEIVNQCDVGVLATRQDQFLDLSFSNKLPEYIVMNKPVIASRLKTINYYFSDEAVLFFEPHNEVDLAQKMVALYRCSSCRQSLVKNALIEYEHINWAVMKNRYLNLLDTII